MFGSNGFDDGHVVSVGEDDFRHLGWGSPAFVYLLSVNALCKGKCCPICGLGGFGNGRVIYFGGEVCKRLGGGCL